MRKKLSLVLILVLVVTLVCPPAQTSAASASLNKTKVTLEVGATIKLKVKNNSETVTWKSSKVSVAKVSSAGLVTAKNEGTATITASFGSEKLTCLITVTDSSENVLNSEEIYEKCMPSVVHITHNEGGGPGSSGNEGERYSP